MRPTSKRLNGDRTKALYDLGFAVHWLLPKSKRPVEMKWATGERKSWPELQALYRRGMNLGVRLGSPSKIGENFLAVIDCDVKSEDPKHREEMLSKLVEIFDEPTPYVISGRGNGSQHRYVTTKRPVRAQRLAQSPEKVKAFMPSAKEPSKYDREHLSEEELKAGYRLRAAWEIALMGEGQQVVLPPSVHPDTGAEYAWGGSGAPILPADFPVFEIEQKEVDRSENAIRDFKAVEVDLVSSTLPDRIVDQIVSGKGVEDRSASLLGVTNSMLKAGLSDDEILSVLTDPDNFLGAVGYEHAQTKSRARAAEWVRRYTLEKSKKETLASEVFNDDVEIEDAVELTREEAREQEADLCPERDWIDQIERGSPDSGGKPKNTLKNVLLILRGEGGSDIFRRDEFANADIYGADGPWGGRKGAEVSDNDTILIKDWLSRKWRFEPSNDRINEAITRITLSNRFHPVRDYLDRLEWDGKPRLDTWLKRLLGAEAAEPYLSAVSRKTLVAMIARIYSPGVKYDQVLILEGDQGRGKSRALNALAGDGWFTDATINVGDKDAVLGMRSIWLVELGELSGMSKADVEALKAFVSTRTDRIRVPYGKRTENFPRQCIFIGSTNQKEYLKDTTGNRRYWPVQVGRCDVEAVAAERDQLFAEAKFAYELGEPLWLEDSAMDEGAQREQSAREIQDAWQDLISDWIERERAGENDDEMTPGIDPNRFRMEDLFLNGGPLAEHGRLNPPEQKRVSDILRKMGFERKTLRVRGGGGTKKFWVRLPLP